MNSKISLGYIYKQIRGTISHIHTHTNNTNNNISWTSREYPGVTNYPGVRDRGINDSLESLNHKTQYSKQTCIPTSIPNVSSSSSSNSSSSSSSSNGNVSESSNTMKDKSLHRTLRLSQRLLSSESYGGGSGDM